MPRPAHRPSLRDEALDRAVDLLRRGESLSLDSVAGATGLTKPGLMYHFPTKEALMTALVDRVVDGCERELEGLLPAGAASPTTHERLAAYLRWALTLPHDGSDLVMLSDPRLRDCLIDRWSERLRTWVEVPEDLPAQDRARLHLVRLAADGCWFADASGCAPLAADERPDVLRLGLELLEPGEGP
ncbi:MAG: TetR/AcrR family transcriptional regulator [Nocardioides sp.]